HEGTFGPGSFVWFPEGMLMEHGATDDAAVTTLFITNKPFDIRYAFEDEQERPPPGRAPAPPRAPAELRWPRPPGSVGVWTARTSRRSMWLGSSAASVVNSGEGHVATAAIRPAARGPRRKAPGGARGGRAPAGRGRAARPGGAARHGDRVGQGHAQAGRLPGPTGCGRAGGPDPAQGGAGHALDDRARGSGRGACGRSGPPTGPGPPARRQPGPRRHPGG